MPVVSLVLRVIRLHVEIVVAEDFFRKSKKLFRFSGISYCIYLDFKPFDDSTIVPVPIGLLRCLSLLYTQT